MKINVCRHKSHNQGGVVDENPGTFGSWTGEGGEGRPLLRQVSVLLKRHFFNGNLMELLPSETQSISNYTKLAVKRSSF